MRPSDGERGTMIFSIMTSTTTMFMWLFKMPMVSKRIFIIIKSFLILIVNLIFIIKMYMTITSTSSSTLMIKFSTTWSEWSPRFPEWSERSPRSPTLAWSHQAAWCSKAKA